MAIPTETISAAYNKYGARGAQAVVLAYFLYRYGRHSPTTNGPNC